MIYETLTASVCKPLALLSLKLNEQWGENPIKLSTTIEGIEYTLDFVDIEGDTAYYKTSDNKTIRISRNWMGYDGLKIRGSRLTIFNQKLIKNLGENAFEIEGETYEGGFVEGHPYISLPVESVISEISEIIRNFNAYKQDKKLEIVELEKEIKRVDEDIKSGAFDDVEFYEGRYREGKTTRTMSGGIDRIKDQCEFRLWLKWSKLTKLINIFSGVNNDR